MARAAVAPRGSPTVPRPARERSRGCPQGSAPDGRLILDAARAGTDTSDPRCSTFPVSEHRDAQCASSPPPLLDTALAVMCYDGSPESTVVSPSRSAPAVSPLRKHRRSNWTGVNVTVYAAGKAAADAVAQSAALQQLVATFPNLRYCSNFGYFGVRGCLVASSIPSPSPFVSPGVTPTGVTPTGGTPSSTLRFGSRRGSGVQLSPTPALWSPQLNPGGPGSAVSGAESAVQQRKCYTNIAFHPIRMFPCCMRLGHVLLNLLGRERAGDAAPGVPAVHLHRPIATIDRRAKLTVCADVIDRIVHSAQEGLDEDYTDICGDPYQEEDVPVPSAEDLWGKEEFVIEVSELQRFAESTKVVSAALPRQFVAELMGLLSCPGARKVYSLFRHVPLREVALDGPTGARLAEELSASRRMADRVVRAQVQARDRIQARKNKHVAASEIQHRPRPGVQSESQVRRPSTASTIDRQSSDESLPRRRQSHSLDELQRAGSGGALDNELLARIEADAADVNYKLHKERTQVRLLDARLSALKDPEAKVFVGRLGRWVRRVPEQWEASGFASREQAEEALDQSTQELAVGICVSQLGHLMVDGSHGGHNQLTPRPPCPTALLFASPIDFSSAAAAERELPRYLVPGSRRGSWAADFRDAEAKAMLGNRCKDIWRSVLGSARQHGARNPSLTPIGLGGMLQRLPEGAVRPFQEICLRAPVEVLCEEGGWGFDTVWMNAGTLHPLLRQVLDETLTGERCMPCNLVLHDRDSKFVASELAKANLLPAYLCPADGTTMLQGLVGGYWELGRGDYFAAEEDCVSTSTACIISSLPWGEQPPDSPG